MLIKTIFLILIFISQFTLADSAFLCQCRAQGPGFEAGQNVDKFCSYSCDCPTKKNIKLEKLKTTAHSFEEWDFGSHICHGQYAFRPTLDAPNWRIEVRFSEFMIDQLGILTYEEPTEISYGILSTIRRNTTAPEILEALTNGYNH